MKRYLIITEPSGSFSDTYYILAHRSVKMTKIMKSFSKSAKWRNATAAEKSEEGLTYWIKFFKSLNKNDNA